MNACKLFSKIRIMAVLLAVFVVGCGNNDPAPLDASKSLTSYSLAGATGTINEAAKTIAVTVPNGTALTALVATFTSTGTGVKIGTTTQTSGTTANNFTSPVAYIVTAADASTATYTVTVTVSPATAKAITTYSLAGVAGTINESAKTISITVPNGTNLTALAATFTTTGKTIKVGTLAQTSGTTTNNFTTPVVYLVTDSNNVTATYTATVIAAASSAKTITAYSLAGVAGTVNATAKTIMVTMPNGTNLTALVATFTSTGKTVKIGTTTQTSGVTVNNFTTPRDYVVTAADNTTATYTVTVTVAANSANAISAFSFAGFTGAAGVITQTTTPKTITVTVPSGTDLTNLVATFTTTGTDVKVGTTVQTSMATANDFTGMVAYKVTAADGAIATYNVTVTIASSSAKDITDFSFAGLTGATGTINNLASPRTIAVTVPTGTDLTDLVATFTTTGAEVKVGTTVQTSTLTPNDFTATRSYIVTAGDSTTETYNVTVTMALGPAPVFLGAAGNYVILAKTAISTVPASVITGDIAVSPAATSYLTGFSLTKVGTTSATSPQVTGNLYGADMTTPTNSNLTTAVTNMGTAYTDAAGRPTPDFLNLGAGEIGGSTLTPGLYKWTTGVTISADAVISGSANDVWIFQIPGNLSLSAAKNLTLSGGAQAKNIFWQVAGTVNLGTTSHFEGIVLCQTSITMGTGASINGRLLAQSAVILDSSTVTAP